MEKNVQKQEEYYNSLVVKNNNLISQISSNESRLTDLLNAKENAKFESEKAKEELDKIVKEVLNATVELNYLRTQLEIVKKDIEIANVSLKTAQQRLDAERKYDIALQNFFEVEPFYIEFLKKVKKTKRNSNGEIVEVSLYDTFLQSRERRKNLINRTLNPARRLPDSVGGVEVDVGRHPEVPYDYEYGL